METVTTDVLVVGSGGAGLTAATVAAIRGLNVILVEKTAVFGGTTAWSGGGIWVPCNSLAKATGLHDGVEQARAYIKGVIGPTVREDLVDAFLDFSPDMVDFLQGNTSVKFSLHEGFADWYQDVPGATTSGRLLAPVEFDGRELGRDLQYLREALHEFNAPAGMMIGFDDMPHIANVKKSWRSLRHVAGLLIRFLWDKARYKRGTRLTMGNALIARLLQSSIKAGVKLWSSAPMLHLETDGDRVVGAVVEKDGRPLRVLAARGVILASGGFSANPEYRQRFIPYPEQHVSMVCAGNNGVAISNALELGAGFDGENISNAGWLVVSVLQQADGSQRKFPHLFLDRGKPGCIAVNRNGKRFGNESTTNLVQPMHDSGSVPAYLLCDHRFIKKYGLGLVRPGGIGLKKMLGAEYVVKGDSLADLAEKTGIEATNLQATVERFNQYAEKGVDDDYGRGGDKEDFSMGDMNHTPNPCLGPIANAPYYAVKIFPGDSTTTVGLKVNNQARVLNQQGEPIPGLQAVGLDMNSLWRGKAPSHGGNNTLSLTFGYIAANALVDQ
ncbi:FAD-dependent oxidoreductase [Flavobacteriaceae bacterium]|jgi:succinate dehydrogenase/fumarate reductase flavoprotein subunit|nr:FAD-dependent oxidoreductase [Flavobacteriaceae bacterium]